MKKGITLMVLFVLGWTSVTFAQDSKAILDKLSAKAKTFKTIEAEYTSRLIDKQSDIDMKQEGWIKVKGDQYVLDLPDYQISTDGVTIWTYEKKQNSCYIDNIEDLEDETFQPSEMFTIWEDDFKSEHKGEVSGLTQINLYPNNPKDKSYHTIQMFIDEGVMEVKKIVLKERDGSEQVYEMKSFKTNGDIPAATFKFDPAKHPGVEMIDNRI